MVYIIRGLPNSGKSTYAKSLNIFHVEADMYHMKDGKYAWTAERMGKAHDWCFDQFLLATLNGFDVAVSNTFTTHKELKRYIDLCKTNSIPYKIIRCEGKKGDNGHNVPDETLQKMRERFVDIEGEEIV